MKKVKRECLDYDTDEIEHCVEAGDDDAIICDEPNIRGSFIKILI
jgi:hypothetical protein